MKQTRQTLINTRLAAELTQKETAAILGITTRYYQHIESGTREGKGYIWDRLQDLFKVDQKELRKVTETKEPL